MTSYLYGKEGQYLCVKSFMSGSLNTMDNVTLQFEILSEEKLDNQVGCVVFKIGPKGSLVPIEHPKKV